MAYNNVGRQSFTYDAELVLADPGTNTTGTSAVVGQVDGSDQILNIGGGRVNGHVILDITAVDVATADELYRFEVQLSTSATFASTIVASAILEIGAAPVVSGDVALLAGRYVLPLSNVLGATAYPYLRIRLVPSGTTPDITWGAWVNKNPF